MQVCLLGIYISQLYTKQLFSHCILEEKQKN